MENEDKLDLVFDNMATGCVIYDVITDVNGNPVDLSINYLNKSYERLFDINKQSLIGKKVTNTNFPHVKEKIKYFGEVALKGNKFHNFVNLDCFNKFIKISAFQTKFGQCAVLSEDITEKRNNEGIAIRKEADFIKCLDLPNIGIAMMASDKTFIEVNDFFCGMLGYSREELIGMTWEEITFTDDLPDNNDIFNRILSDETEFCTLNKRYVRKNGETIWVCLNVRWVRNEYGSLSYALVIIWDINENKNKEEALKKSEEKYHEIFESATEGIFQTTPDGKIINSNPSFARIFGYESAEEIMKNVTDMEKQIYYNPYDRRKINKILENGGFVNEFEARALRKDGTGIWISINAHAVRNEKRDVVCIDGTVTDITGQKNMMADLKESEFKFRSIFENALDAIGVIKKGRFEMINPLFVKMFGYDDEKELLGESVMKIIAPIFHEKIEGYLAVREIGGEAPTRYEVKGLKKDGGLFDIEVNIVTYKIKDVLQTMAIIIDITSRKKVEENLNQLSNFLNNILESYPVSIIVLDKNLNIIMSNKCSEKMFGIDKIRDYQRNIFDFDPEFEKLSDCLTRVLTNKDIIDKKNISFMNQEKKIFINAIIYPIMENDEVVGLVLNIQDVTENVMLEQNLIQNEKLKAIGELSAGMAHEINQPLTGIIMSSDNIMDYILADDIDKIYIENKLVNIISYADRIKKIIEHVRAFSRDQGETLLMAVDVNEAVNNALSLVSTQYRRHNIDLRLELADSPPSVKGNIYKVEQVVLVLLSNSKDAVLEKDEKKLYKKGERKTIGIRTYSMDDRIYLDVYDNGIGINDDNKKRLFMPFFTTKEINNGTGLGLSVVYGILKEMSAEISVSSVVGERTNIAVSFNICKEMKNGQTERINSR
jgi:PAS domain S-box-containing protein